MKAEDKPVAEKAIKEMAEKYEVSTGQIILKWDIQQGRIVIPKSESDKHIAANLALDGFTLTDDELRAIDNLNKDLRFGGDPDNAWKENLERPVP